MKLYTILHCLISRLEVMLASSTLDDSASSVEFVICSWSYAMFCKVVSIDHAFQRNEAVPYVSLQYKPPISHNFPLSFLPPRAPGQPFKACNFKDFHTLSLMPPLILPKYWKEKLLHHHIVESSNIHLYEGRKRVFWDIVSVIDMLEEVEIICNTRCIPKRDPPFQYVISLLDAYIDEPDLSAFLKLPTLTIL